MTIRRWTSRALFACAVSMLAYCGYILIDSRIFQKAELRQFQRLLTDRQQAILQKPQPVAADGLIGRIEIPRLGLSVIVMEGTTRTILGRAAGHIVGTVLPGQPGNMGISAHRDTFFRPLRNIRQNDNIILTTMVGEFRYRVVSMKVVNPEDLAVLDSSTDEILTLVTCYPFYFIGSAPKRFIVRAERVI